jgi:anti-sigma B factor antagonist
MLKVTEENGIKVASFDNHDRFNAVIYQEVKEKLNSLLEPNSKLILDLDGVKFVDSSGFGAMLSVFKTARSNDSVFKICSINQEVLELVKLMKLHNVFDIHDNLESCKSSF